MAAIIRFFDAVNRGLSFLAPVADLAVRLWVANVFFKSGLTKLQSFDSTLLLFQYEYEVPFLSPQTAAYLGTATELILPVFLALGLLGRYAAIALFVFNIVAVISYPALEAAGLRDHQVWGVMLLVTLCRGPGRLSFDHLVERWLLRRGEKVATAQAIAAGMLGLFIAWYLIAQAQGHVAVGVMGALAAVAYLSAHFADRGSPATGPQRAAGL